MTLFVGRSIRFKLTVLFTLFLMAMLSLFAVLILQRFDEILYSDTDIILKSKIEGLETSINVYWDFYQRTKAAEQTFVQIAREWIYSRSSETQTSGFVVRIYKPDGSLVADNRKDLQDFQFDKELLKRIHQQGILVDNTKIKNFIGFDIRLRSCFKYVESRRQDYIIHAAFEISQMEEPLGQLRFVIMLLFPIFLLLSALLASVLIRQSLFSLTRFMNGLTQESQSISLRFSLEDFQESDTKNLAKTFNALMDRIDATFAQQRQVFEDLSHQIKTPLAVMRGELELTLKKTRTIKEYKEVIASALEENQRMSAIVENLLKLARFDAQETNMEYSLFNISELLQGIYSQMQKLALSRQVHLKLECPENLEIHADRFKIQQAILNLVDNAIKYSRIDTDVTLKAIIQDDKIQVSVHDFGAVIPQNEIPQVFDRFWRSKSTMSEKGYGIGLSIVKALVEMHGGTIELTSDIEQGTLFLLKLPQKKG